MGYSWEEQNYLGSKLQILCTQLKCYNFSMSNHKINKQASRKSKTSKYCTIESTSTKEHTYRRHNNKPMRKCKPQSKKSGPSKQPEKLVNKITSKIAEGECSSLINISLSVMSSRLMEKKFTSFSVSEDTQEMIEKMKKQSNQYNSHSPRNSLHSFSYEKILKESLQNFGSSPKLSINRQSSSLLQSEASWRRNVQNYKVEQARQWNLLNLQLRSYLHQNGCDLAKKQKMIESLIRQGNANYRWFQVQDKVDQKKAEIMESALGKSCKSFQSVEKVEPSDIDQPLEQIFLRNYNWDKYVWDDGEESMDLKNADLEAMQLSSAAIIEEDEFVNETIEIAINWLLDEFVIELAEHLDLHLFMRSQGSWKKLEEQKLSPKQRQDRYQRIQQHYEDCRQIDLIGTMGDPEIRRQIVDAFEQSRKQHPKGQISQIKSKLKEMVCLRRMELEKLEEVALDGLERQIVSEVEEFVFEAVIIRQVCWLLMN